MQACLDDLEAFALVAGRLAPERVASVVEHADACSTCRELIEGLCAPEQPVADRSALPDALVDELIDLQIGSYRIEALLAVGGMGRVYRAKDLALGRDVAIKLPRSQARWLMRRFEREVTITARFANPGIVPILATGTLPDGRPFYVMQIVDGISLDAAIARAVNREQRLALVEHVVAVANTMAYVHAEGIAHRDLKPQNVLIGTLGGTVIIDWGLAKDLSMARASAAPGRVSSSEPIDAITSSTGSVSGILAGRTTRPGDVLGTPAFMAPEQARGEEIDRRADVYAVGAMLEHLLTGRLPRKAADAALDQAPRDLVAICRRAMAAERDDRYPDCGALAAELRAALRPRVPVREPVPTRSWHGVALGIGGGVGIGLAIARLVWS